MSKFSLGPIPNVVTQDGQPVPIDIPFDKFNEWLIARKRLDPAWPLALKSLQHHLTTATKDLSPALQAQLGLADGRVPDYFDAVQVLAALEAERTAAGQSVKTLFGRYATPQLKTWASIKETYERGNVHLAEAAKRIAHALDFDMPAWRRAIAASQSSQADLGVRIAAHAAAASAARKHFAEDCAKAGVPSAGVTRAVGAATAAAAAAALQEGVLAASADLGPLFEVVEEGIRAVSVAHAAAYYRAFLARAAELAPATGSATGEEAKSAGDGQTGAGAGAGVADDEQEEVRARARARALLAGVNVLPTLAQLCAQPFTPSAAKSGAAGEADETAASAKDATSAAAASDADLIDWGITLEDSASSSTASSSSSSSSASAGGAGDEIVWDFTVEDSADSSAPASTSSAASTGTGALSTGTGITSTVRLADRDARAALLRELEELEAFLSARTADLAHRETAALFGLAARDSPLGRLVALYETSPATASPAASSSTLSSASSSFSSASLAEPPPDLLLLDASSSSSSSSSSTAPSVPSLVAMREAVSAAAAALGASRLQQLLQAREFPAQLERLVSRLVAPLLPAFRADRRAQEDRDRLRGAAEGVVKAQRGLADAQAELEATRAKLTKELRRQYKCPVSLMANWTG